MYELVSFYGIGDYPESEHHNGLAVRPQQNG
jgi:hypothetical protein